MPIQPPGEAQIHVACHAPPLRYDLRFYGSAEFVVPGWWLGVTDPEGQLQRTEFLPSTGGPVELCDWLEPITGPRQAALLVTLVNEPVVKPRPPSPAVA